jgi:hypothetical protein
MTAAVLPRDTTTGRFTRRPGLPTCTCGRIQHENLAGGLLCVFERCELRGQVVGHSGADVGVLAE